MSKFRFLVNLLLLLLHLCLAAVAIASENKAWLTLDGNAPLVIAKGGFAGVFPDSSSAAYEYASRYSLPNMISWCNVQLTKDGVGVCLPELDLQNSTEVDVVFASKKATYIVNNVSTTGWFPPDFTHRELSILKLTQGVYSRSPDFDRKFRIRTVEDVSKIPISPDSKAPRSLWLNFQNDAFYKEHGLRLEGYAAIITTVVDVKYISSPELEFLRGYRMRGYKYTPKLVLQFGQESDIEPTNNVTYGTLLKNLRPLKDSIDGILVPKSYIWPVDSKSFLLPHTSLVSDAHKYGLQVFVYGISNDVPFAYDFNSDPVAENLAFIGNQNFAVDGVLSDFPITPSAAIDCFSHMGKDDPPQKNFLIISNEGASGEYPGCSDLAYQSAFNDSADIITCPVQITKDGLALCLGSMNLMKRTNVAQSPYGNLARDVPELGGMGIYTFDLTWDQIHNLQPEILNPDIGYHLYPNPKHRGAAKLMPLWVLANTIIGHRESTSKHVSGLLISIENAVYLSEKHRLDVVDAVVDVLRTSHILDLNIRIMIQSSEKAVLTYFKQFSNFQRLYEIKQGINVNNIVVDDIKNFADTVVISKALEFPDNNYFLTDEVPIIRQLKENNVGAYVKLFRNEFVYQAWDFFSDPYVELNTYIDGAGADGVITDFPRTANNYRRNRCLGMSKRPSYMSPIIPGELFKYVRSDSSPDPLSTPQTSANNYASNRRLGKHNKTSHTVPV